MPKRKVFMESFVPYNLDSFTKELSSRIVFKQNTSFAIVETSKKHLDSQTMFYCNNPQNVSYSREQNLLQIKHTLRMSVARFKEEVFTAKCFQRLKMPARDLPIEIKGNEISVLWLD